MNTHNVAVQLESIATSDHFVADSYDLIDQWSSAGVGSETLEPILRFMETHPDIDYGLPGPLVAFLERFYRNGYEDELVTSVQRRPTFPTIKMLQRVVNSAERHDERRLLIDVMREVSVNPAADEDAVQEAAELLQALD